MFVADSLFRGHAGGNVRRHEFTIIQRHPMLQLILSSVALSIAHATIPNHWMPLIAIGRAEKWKTKETLAATGITGFSHILSTIIIGVFVGWLGIKLSSRYEHIFVFAAPLILIVLGIIYLFMDWAHMHHHAHLGESVFRKKKSKWMLIATLSTAMFFSPCIELETYYFTAGAYGWTGILIVSAIYLIVTVSGMMVLVYMGWKGLKRWKFHFMEHHEKAVTGIILILIGFSFYWFD